MVRLNGLKAILSITMLWACAAHAQTPVPASLAQEAKADDSAVSRASLLRTGC